jgi:hypothetical protein
MRTLFWRLLVVLAALFAAPSAHAATPASTGALVYAYHSHYHAAVSIAHHDLAWPTFGLRPHHSSHHRPLAARRFDAPQAGRNPTAHTDNDLPQVVHGVDTAVTTSEVARSTQRTLVLATRSHVAANGAAPMDFLASGARVSESSTAIGRDDAKHAPELRLNRPGDSGGSLRSPRLSLIPISPSTGNR